MNKTIKILLAIIAAGLWVNIGLIAFRPAPAVAQAEEDLELLKISNNTASLEDALSDIAHGTCTNSKIC